MRVLSKLFLFVHALPRIAEERVEYLGKWEQLMQHEAPNEENALCILSVPREKEELKSLGLKHFGERCIIDPYDSSPETVALLGGDLLRTMSERGRQPGGAVTSVIQAWSAYEMWSFKNARLWSAGLKRGLEKIGFAWDPQQLQVISCGMQWCGCLAKYSNFIPICMGLERPADVLADLSPQAGWPAKATFTERISLDRNVFLFLFKTPTGRPMAHFVDGLRAVWEPEHTATVAIDPHRVRLVRTGEGLHQVTKDGFTAVVSSGCNSILTVLAGDGMGYDEFKKTMNSARIESMHTYSSYLTDIFPYQDPITMVMDRDSG